MCLSKVFVDKNGERKLLMEEVTSVKIGGGKLFFKTLFGEQKEIEGNIKQIDFLAHTITMENLGK